MRTKSINLVIFQLRDARITAACNQFAIELPAFREGLARSNIMLNRYVVTIIMLIPCLFKRINVQKFRISRKSLADLAAWEPKSFESLALIARERAAQDGLRGLHEIDADNRVVYSNDEQKEEKEKYENVTPANYSAWYREKPY